MHLGALHEPTTVAGGPERNPFGGALPCGAAGALPTVVLANDPRMCPLPAQARGRAALDRDARDLLRAMTRLMRGYQFRDRDRMGYHGLTITQTYVLELLLAEGAQPLQVVADAMHLDKSTLSRVVATMVRKGFLRRRQHASDGRSVLFSATATGARRYGRVEADLVAENRRVLRTVAPGTRRQFVKLLDLMSDAVTTRVLEPAAD